jgi:hypothetical protein
MIPANPMLELDWLESTFSGREKELHLITNILEKKDDQFAFVLGPRGIGKSTFCIFYAKSRKNFYDKYIWLHCHSFNDEKSIVPYLFSEIAHSLGERPTSQQDLELFIKTGMGRKRLLIILDDFHILDNNALSILVKQLYRLPHQLKFIFCGRSLVGMEDNQNKLFANSIILPTLTESEMWQMIRNRMAFAPTDSYDSQEFLNKLHSFGIERFNFSPRFILDVLSSYWKNGDFQAAIQKSSHDYFDTFSNLLIVPEKDGIKVLPASKLAVHQILTPKTLYLTACPYIIVPNINHIWKDQIDEFEEFLNDPNVKESAFQAFFERNTHFLKGIDYKSVLPHPVLERDHGDTLIPDFFLQPLNSELADVLDLKTPSANILVQQKNRLHLGHSVTEGIAQLREYRDYFEESKYRESIRNKYGITAYRPNTILVIGRSHTELSEEKIKQLMDTNPSYVKVISYDDLHLKMKRMLELEL